MDTNDAVRLVKDFLARYQSSGAWHVAAEQIHVAPSVHTTSHIAVVFGFAPSTADDQLDTLKQQPIDALVAAHPELAGFTFQVEAEIIKHH